MSNCILDVLLELLKIYTKHRREGNAELVQ